ncbi:MAG TPA: class I SAM-dependent methyltransferase [Solirubrobacterales bacterium]|nr:class I SAM-dependent methyltransferase [Solirubrobacterales bacterium]
MSEAERAGPPTRIRLIGRALNATVARAPWLWPVLRAPMRRYFDARARDWDEGTGAGSVDHLEALAVGVTHVSPEPERILDLGTGTGVAALFLAREFPRASVRGVDVSEEMIRAAQAKVGLDPDGRIAFRVADAGSLPYADDSFDLVTQINVPPFFSEIARVLRPAGHVIFVASGGSATPFYTPPAVLERGLRRRGIDPIASGEAGRGNYVVGRAGRE